MYRLVTSLSNQSSPEFTIWLWGCMHKKKENDNGYNSIRTPIEDIELLMNYDLSLMLGDFSSPQEEPTITEQVHITEGEDIVEGFTHSQYPRAHYYELAGNHDGSTDMGWYLRYIDPLGENTFFSGVDNTQRPYQPVYLDWHTYYIELGDVLIIMISDRNDLPWPLGRKDSPEEGGHPSGAMTLETWDWVKNIILTNTDKRIIVNSHQNPEETTIATGVGDGTEGGYHGPSGIEEGNGILYSIYDEQTGISSDGGNEIIDFFANNQHSVVVWQASHTHHNVGETFNNKGFRKQRDGVEYINIGQITRFHNATRTTDRKSWRLEIFQGHLKYTMIDHDSKQFNFNNQFTIVT